MPTLTAVGLSVLVPQVDSDAWVDGHVYYWSGSGKGFGLGYGLHAAFTPGSPCYVEEGILHAILFDANRKAGLDQGGSAAMVYFVDHGG